MLNVLKAIRRCTSADASAILKTGINVGGSGANSFNNAIDNKNTDSTKTKGNISTNNEPAILHINCMKNNIFFTVSKPKGVNLFKMSSGSVGFTNAQKKSSKCALSMLDVLKTHLDARKIERLRVTINGISSTRYAIVGQLKKMGLRIVDIIDTTGIPFNGCRQKKSRRL